jgi:hypothetical protein
MFGSDAGRAGWVGWYEVTTIPLTILKLKAVINWLDQIDGNNPGDST